MAKLRVRFAEQESPFKCRSLNHRHLDLQLRAPREYLSFEEEIRKVIRQKISQGKAGRFY